jgi:predicted phage-related endonuclease
MLSPQQIEQRAGKLTASRIACLMTGDAAKIHALWLEMIGEAQPEALSHVWPVRLGEATEQLNLDWFEMKNAMPVIRRGEVVVHPEYPWAACTLDGFVEDDRMGYALEGKHCGGREPLEVITERYQPQCQWIMFVTNTKQIALSVIMGASEPIVEYLDRDDTYIAEMIKRGKQFMDCVKERRAPVALPAVPAPIDASKIYDFSTNNAWMSHGVDWLLNKDAAKIADEASKILKSLVPADAKKVHGGGVRVTRDRAGRLSLREGNS